MKVKNLFGECITGLEKEEETGISKKDQNRQEKELFEMIDDYIEQA